MRNTTPPTAAPGAAATETKERLSGDLGTTSLVLSVLAFSAPIVTVSGFIAFTVLFAGTTSPIAFLTATVVLTIFAVGFTTMTKHIPRPGAFYAYVTMGLGKIVGLGGAYLAIVSYSMIITGLYSFTGITMAALIQSFGGPETPWWVWSFAALALVGVLGYFHIELSAKVLSVVMVLEVVVVMTFNVATLSKGGAEGLSAAPFNAVEFFSQGEVGVALLFAFLTFIGFEATALYRDEVKDPNKTVPRATYLAVIFVGLLYCLSCYALVSAYGSTAVETATNNPAGMFNDALDRFVMPGFSNVSLVLVASSCVAALISTHNVIARYLFNIGSDRALPSYLSKVHKRHHSPYKASVTVSVVIILALLSVVISGADPGQFYGQMAGLGSTGVLVLMALVSLAVAVFFFRKGVPASENAWKVFIAPIVSAVALTAVVVFAIMRFELVVGGEPGQNLGLLYVLGASLVLGILFAAYVRSAKPQIYSRLGRQETAEADMS
ncbi:APC family permease [Arthrobacter sp. BE255]|uniref:APC family permease n=1 Tax=Arthrobacter sp. BE255 TaxID=2817721 RepID=UPI002863BDA2|nr:APC family permease [Arthrobacter sp. BE255]MDR7159880.1 amino acid transporter [Arthrobacter sp. BE255]